MMLEESTFYSTFFFKRGSVELGVFRQFVETSTRDRTFQNLFVDSRITQLKGWFLSETKMVSR